MFEEFLNQLEALRSRTARFRRVALHLHSPDSHDWADGPCDPDLNSPERFAGESGLALFRTELHRHLDVAAITDHMRCTFASDVGAGGEADGQVVLPGMELNFRPEAALGVARIHLLVVLPHGSTTHSFERLFAGLSGIPAQDDKRTGQEEVTGITLKDWVDRVHGEHGICIAAHVDSAAGVRSLFRHTSRDTLKLFSADSGTTLEQEHDVPEALKEYLFRSGLDAVEVGRPHSGRHYRWESRIDGVEKWIPAILQFDSHCIEDLSRSERVTHLKMTRLDIDGVKDAFAFPDTRIRFPDSVPSPPSPRLLGVQVTGGPVSFFADATMAFAENLSCLIGVRGSGKSTIVEALRYVFGLNRLLDDLGRLRDGVVELQEANLVGTLIRVAYRTANGDTRILEATYDAKSEYVTQVYSAEGEALDISDVARDYPIRLFGWSEVETLGRNPLLQRELLDRLVPEISSALRRRRELRSNMATAQVVVERAVGQLNECFNRDNQEIRRYTEFKEDYERLDTAEVRELFLSLDVARAKRAVLVEVRARARELKIELEERSDGSLRRGLPSVLEGVDPSINEWWIADESRAIGVAEAENDINDFIRRACGRLDEFLILVDTHVASLERAIADLEQRVHDEVAADTEKKKLADLRSNAKERLERVVRLRDEYQAYWRTLLRSIADRNRVGRRVARAQDEIAGIRAKHSASVGTRLNEFLPANMNVTIDFVAGGDKADCREAVEPLVAKAYAYLKRDLAATVSHHFTPVEFARMLLKGNLSQLVGLRASSDGAAGEIKQEDVTAIAEDNVISEYDEHAAVRVLRDSGGPLRRILNLQEVKWDDHEAILLNGDPVNKKSPGQRSSAMLPLIALTETTPLIVDQPEDNLDRRLIGTVLVNILAELKEKRQIVVCTHDPNILVGGDAEQVVLLEAESDRRGSVTRHGSIDNDDIVDTVIELLEGGAEAFEARRKRYEGRTGPATT